MSEQAPESTPVPTAPPAPPATDPAPNEHPPELGDAGKRAIDAMKAERDAARREAKANAEAAQRLAELEESQKSEQQKIADRAAAAERERDEARTEGLRYKAAAQHGISEDYFDLLGTGDAETISGRATRVGALLKEHAEATAENANLKAELEALKAGRPAPTTPRPTSSLKPGATSDPVDPPNDNSYPSNWLPRRQQ